VLRLDGSAASVVQSRSTKAGYTFDYSDPYYMSRREYGAFCDVYSLGLVLLQMLTARPIGGKSVHVLVVWCIAPTQHFDY
jgi:hypothetical protein